MNAVERNLSHDGAFRSAMVHPMILLFRAAAWLLLVAIMALTFVPPTYRPVSGLGQGFEHATAFLAMGAAFALAYRHHVRALGVALLLYTGLLECLQIFVPGRHARLSDFAVDALGVLFGLVVGTWLSRLAPSS
jgi:VanZ family protein